MSFGHQGLFSYQIHLFVMVIPAGSHLPQFFIVAMDHTDNSRFSFVDYKRIEMTIFSEFVHFLPDIYTGSAVLKVESVCSRFLPHNKHQLITLDRQPWPAYESTPQVLYHLLPRWITHPSRKKSNSSRRASTDIFLRGVEDVQTVPDSEFLYTTTPSPSTPIVLESISSSYGGSSIIELSSPGELVLPTFPKPALSCDSSSGTMEHYQAVEPMGFSQGTVQLVSEEMVEER